MDKQPTQRCYDIARTVLEKGSVLPPTVFGQAGKSVYEKYGKRLYCYIDTEYFFYTS